MGEKNKKKCADEQTDRQTEREKENFSKNAKVHVTLAHDYNNSE